MKPKAYFIVSRYNEDYSWIEHYTPYYLIYNKGEQIISSRVINVPNIGNNQRDIFDFIVNSYKIIPEFTAFIQANPFDHCKKEVFDKLIYKEHFTPIEYYGPVPENGWQQRSSFDDGYMEINNSWYIQAHNEKYNQTCKYNSFDDFMYKYFTNYHHLDWLRFAPGSQYIVERKQILYYPKTFWKSLMDELTLPHMTEGHIIERALWMIFQCTLEIKDEFK
jgi:hypothetical protein